MWQGAAWLLLAARQANVLSAEEVNDLERKVLDAKIELHKSLVQLGNAQTGDVEKLKTATNSAKDALGDLGASIDKDFGISKGLSGIAENLTKFIAGLAFAPAFGAMRGAQTALGFPGGEGTGSGLAGAIAASMGYYKGGPRDPAVVQAQNGVPAGTTSIPAGTPGVPAATPAASAAPTYVPGAGWSPPGHVWDPTKKTWVPQPGSTGTNGAPSMGAPHLALNPKNGSIAGLKPQSLALLELIQGMPQFAGISLGSAYRAPGDPADQKPGGGTFPWHPNGQGLDLNLNANDPAQSALGDQLKAFLETNKALFGINHVLWKTMEGGNHFNHLHIGMNGSGNGMPDTSPLLQALGGVVPSVGGTGTTPSLASLGSGIPIPLPVTIVGSTPGGLPGIIPPAGTPGAPPGPAPVLPAAGAPAALGAPTGAKPGSSGYMMDDIGGGPIKKYWTVQPDGSLVWRAQNGNPIKPPANQPGVPATTPVTAWPPSASATPAGGPIPAVPIPQVPMPPTPSKTPMPAGYAGGGKLRGPGTGTSDSILARVSTGEFIVKASEAAKHFALLQAINQGQVPGYAGGGLIPAFAPGGIVPDPNNPTGAGDTMSQLLYLYGKNNLTQADRQQLTPQVQSLKQQVAQNFNSRIGDINGWRPTDYTPYGTFTEHSSGQALDVWLNNQTDPKNGQPLPPTDPNIGNQVRDFMLSRGADYTLWNQTQWDKGGGSSPMPERDGSYTMRHLNHDHGRVKPGTQIKPPPSTPNSLEQLLYPGSMIPGYAPGGDVKPHPILPGGHQGPLGWSTLTPFEKLTGLGPDRFSPPENDPISWAFLPQLAVMLGVTGAAMARFAANPGESVMDALGRHATGGPVGSIRGPGTGTSDSILARLSNKEFVVKASEATKHLALLNAINQGQVQEGYSVGGSVPRTPFSPDPFDPSNIPSPPTKPPTPNPKDIIRPTDLGSLLGDSPQAPTPPAPPAPVVPEIPAVPAPTAPTVPVISAPVVPAPEVPTLPDTVLPPGAATPGTVIGAQAEAPAGYGGGFDITGGGLLGLAQQGLMMAATSGAGMAGAAAAMGGGGGGMGMGAGSDAAAAIASLGMETAIKLGERGIEYGAQVAGIGVQGLLETFLPAGGSELANSNWLTRIVGGIAGAAPALANLAGGNNQSTLPGVGAPTPEQIAAQGMDPNRAQHTGAGAQPGPYTGVHIENYTVTSTEDRAGQDIARYQPAPGAR